MVSKLQTILAGCLTALAAIPMSAQAQLLYCCNDARSVKHCSDSLPRACIGRAYSVRAPGGRVIREVEAPLTPEQRAAKEELERKRKLEEEARAEQARLDKALLATYSSEDEIDKARERAERDVDASMGETKKRLEAAEKRHHDLTDPNRIRERISPAEHQRKVDDAKREMETQRELLAIKEKEQLEIAARYSEEKRRYLEIKSRRSFPGR